MLQYILQAILFQLAFLLVYEFLLKKETFFNANRAYLLITPVLSLLLPFLKVEGLSSLFPADSVQALTSVLLPEVFIGDQPQTVQQLPQVVVKENGFQINWWLVFYGLGLLATMMIFLKRFSSLNRLFRFRKISEEKNFRIIEIPNSKIACTFFNTVFLGDKITESERQQILSHELVHIHQKHSLDLMFFEIQKIIFWFNPLLYIYQNRISTLHEFIADASVVKRTGKEKYYEQLLNTTFNTRNISFINQFFNHSLIKKRIIMLQKSKSKSIAKFKFLIIVPLLLIMLTYVACSDNSEEIPQDQSISEQLTQIKNAIEDGKELTDAEKQQFFSLMQQIIEDGNYPPPPSQTRNVASGADVPFAVIEEVPVFPGCENESDEEAKKKCMSSGIANFVNSNFKVKEMREFAEVGMNRVIVQFKIDASGKVVDAKARASSPELETEAIRVINSLPQMQPGKQKGKEVGVMYSLPIVFQVDE
ncbi:M56 family metallopeptidase [Salegentibacter flavus]|uniref:Signal transducer regulating beta-lactamase production, contains metallopeptidase domain n=1 Tax=Salegentibacter flavus TaxID=287099 RepID=A0A1I4XWA3_9FLAO|nr:M56 family metallopeptidase [Salegentibacter flavus]SFN30138.1 Signal transducer regulating beta-lactamase production, contains metallopeptidase domain [Salegentibacter flavus]